MINTRTRSNRVIKNFVLSISRQASCKHTRFREKFVFSKQTVLVAFFKFLRGIVDYRKIWFDEVFCFFFKSELSIETRRTSSPNVLFLFGRNMKIIGPAKLRRRITEIRIQNRSLIKNKFWVLIMLCIYICLFLLPSDWRITIIQETTVFTRKLTQTSSFFEETFCNIYSSYEDLTTSRKKERIFSRSLFRW